MSDVRVQKTISRSLPCKLTPEELLRAGGDLAACVQDMATEESRQVDIKAQLKAALAELDGRRTRLAIVVSRREEYRDVQVDVFEDFQRGVIEDIRRDTGEILSTRQMSDAERQRHLPLES